MVESGTFGLRIFSIYFYSMVQHALCSVNATFQESVDKKNDITRYYTENRTFSMEYGDGPREAGERNFRLCPVSPFFAVQRRYSEDKHQRS